MERRFLLTACVIGFLGVALGAFGAHGLEATLEANGRVDTFETASRYQMYHALALLAVGILSAQFRDKKYLNWAGYCFIAGTVIFSGSLYILAIADLGFMGAIAPIGGTALLAGWACLGMAALRNTPHA